MKQAEAAETFAAVPEVPDAVSDWAAAIRGEGFRYATAGGPSPGTA